MSEPTVKSKLHEPILNPIQIIVLLGIVIFEVIVNILPLLMGLNISPIWVIITMAGGIVCFAVTSLLRAAYPEEVPDTRITTAFKIFIKQVIDALVANPEDKSDLKSLLERLMVWAVREWDAIYQVELAEAIEYAKKKMNGSLAIKAEAEELTATDTLSHTHLTDAEAEQKELI